MNSEASRRKWADEQSPKLVTSLQAKEMFGNRSLKGLREHLISKGLKPYISSQWPNSTFYLKEQIEVLAEEYFEVHPQNRVNAKYYRENPYVEIDYSYNNQDKRYTKPKDIFIPESNWTIEQFMDKYGFSITYQDAAKDILARSRSIRILSPYKAFFIVKVLTDGVINPIGTPGYKSDKNSFIQAVNDCECNRAEKDDLRKIVFKLYSNTEIGRLNPFEVVPVILDLMLSK